MILGIIRRVEKGGICMVLGNIRRVEKGGL